MFNKILIALGIRKKVGPDTQVRRSTDNLDFPESEITEAYASGKLPKRTAHTFVGKGHLYVGGKQMPPAPMPTQRPPKAPPPSKTVFYDPGIASSVQEEGQRIIRTMPVELFSSDTDGIQAKGGEFSGAGASGSWDSPSSSSSDTSSSSSDSEVTYSFKSDDFAKVDVSYGLTDDQISRHIDELVS